MSIQYAPIIDQKIPGFTNLENVYITIKDNPFLIASDIKGYGLRVFSALGNELTSEPIFSNTLNFNLLSSSNKLNIEKKWFYKIQIAYYNGEEYGPYSSLSTIKYSLEPSIQITYNGTINVYTIVYSNSDLSENLKNYKIKITDTQGQVLEETDEILATNEYYDKLTNTYIYYYTGKNALKENKEYIFSLEGKTSNLNINFVGSIFGIELKDSIFAADETSDFDRIYLDNFEYDIDNGLNILSLASHSNNNINQNAHFIIIKKEEKSIYEDVAKFDFVDGELSTTKIIDNNIKPNCKYTYAIQQINKYGLRTKPFSLKTAEKNNYPYIFLQDAERQLCIRLNPDISSFKDTIQEQKMETIGSKYPVFYRNAHIKYKEFPLSGLISMNMDKDEYFMFYNNFLDKANKNTYDLTAGNIDTELKFKLTVLDWLNNGEPKLLRSPTEGNYIIRLNGISLSPEKTLGRMLHSFSATCYEIDEYNTTNLLKYNLINNDRLYQNKLYNFTYDISKNGLPDDNIIFPNSILYLQGLITSFTISYVSPTDKYYITYEDNTQDIITFSTTNLSYLYQGNKKIKEIKSNSIPPNSGFGLIQGVYQKEIEFNTDFEHIKEQRVGNKYLSGNFNNKDKEINIANKEVFSNGVEIINYIYIDKLSDITYSSGSENRYLITHFKGPVYITIDNSLKNYYDIFNLEENNSVNSANFNIFYKENKDIVDGGI